MNRSLAQKFRLLVIKAALELIMFIDFLEDLPQKFVKLFVLVSIFIVSLTGLNYIYSYEQRTNNIHTIMSALLIHEYESQPLDLSDRYPILIKNIPLPEISARSVLITDVTRDKVLYEFNSKTPLPPASTTKLMTALVAKDLYSLDTELFVPEYCTKLDTAKIGFVANERIRVNDLLNALLVSSSGDAACTLARGKITEEEFVGRMNQYSQDLGLSTSIFSNPIGLDDFTYNHVSSAQDLYKLAMASKKDPVIRKIVQTKEYNLSSGFVSRKVFNTNDLLWDIPGTIGVKTGRTYGAGEVLIFEYNRNNVNIMIIVMGSLDRFKDTKVLLEWTLQSFDFG